MKRAQPEAALHRAVADYLALAIRPPDFFTTFPAGGGGRVRGGILKAAGLKPGIPDVLLIRGDPGRVYWIELKTDTGRLSPAQRAMRKTLTAAHCPVAVCRSVDEVKGTLWAWGFVR